MSASIARRVWPYKLFAVPARRLLQGSCDRSDLESGASTVPADCHIQSCCSAVSRILSGCMAQGSCKLYRVQLCSSVRVLRASCSFCFFPYTMISVSTWAGGFRVDSLELKALGSTLIGLNQPSVIP